MSSRLLLTVATGLLWTLAADGADVPLRLQRLDGPDTSFRQIDDGPVELRGSCSVRMTPTAPLSSGDRVLELEYFCTGGAEKVSLNAGPPFETMSAISLPPMANSETWTPYVVRLSSSAKDKLLTGKDLKLDVSLKPDVVLQLRNIRVRPERPGEFERTSASPNASSAEEIEAYLNHVYPAELTTVAVGQDRITIEGHLAGARDNLFLGDVPMECLVTARRWNSLTLVIPDDLGRFTVTVPRTILKDGLTLDRLTSRWQILRREADGEVPVSHARYADTVACRTPELPPAIPASKKGLGGWSPSNSSELKDELDQLHISAVTVNVFPLHQFVALREEPGTTPFTWQGRTYYARENQLAGYDATFREAEKRGVMVSAILLISNPARTDDLAARLLGHPDAVKDGQFAMPNITSPDGIAYYGAILNLLMERWSKTDGVHGRVHHWIVHNEVDFGWVWTNAGQKTDVAYMDLYQRSLRLVQLIASQYDPHARAFITLTHHWADPGSKYGYGSKRLLELLLRFCRAEGDFAWALAFHPYPQNLRNPRTWEDKLATFDFNTPQITPRNLEVLDAYMKLPALLYRGAVRPVHLSENGFNSRDYSPKSLEDQAAGMALAWKKMSVLSSVQSWQYHNWIDNRGEGGLRIGLRRFPDDAEEPLGKKPIWHLYQALGTPEEDAACRPYLKTIGISAWDEVIHRGEIH